MAELIREGNRITVAGGQSSTDSTVVLPFLIDSITGRVLMSSAGGGGTVTSVSVVTANGFAGTVATATTTPAITLQTTLGSGNLALSNGTGFVAAPLTGTGNVVLATSPTFSGATITTSSVNGVTLTTGGSATAFLNGAGAYTTPSTVAGSIVVGTTTVTSGTTTRILYNNAGVLGEYTLTGSGTVAVMQNTPTLTTPVLGVATATSINKVAITAPASSATLTIADGKTLTVTNGGTLAGGDAFVLAIAAAKTLTVSNTLTLAGTDSTVMTFPTTSATIARTDAAQTFTGIQTIPQIVNTPLAATVTSNAATITRASRINNFTNSSAATMAITLSTTGALDGDLLMVRIYDFSAVAQTIGWTNTENSTVTAPLTSNGSTTLPVTAGFQFNGGSSKWRCIASA